MAEVMVVRMQVHVAGVGDFSMERVSSLEDPCPLPNKIKKRSLNEKERLLYAPMSNVGNVTIDQDVVYIKISDHKVNFTRPEDIEPEGDTGAWAASVMRRS